MQTRRTAGDPNGKSNTVDASKRLPRTQKGWRTRERLINAAAAVINAEGYQASTVENIARKAEVPIGLYYRYFKDKTDIAFAALGKAAEEYRGGVQSLAAQRSLFGREMAVHELLYETLRDNFRMLSSYFSARKEDGKLVAFFQQQTTQFMEDFYAFLTELNVVPPITRQGFEVLGRALIGFSENTLHRNFAGLDAGVAVPTQNRSMMVRIMSELRYRALTCEDPSAAGYTPVWTMRLRRGKRPAFTPLILARAFNIPMEAASTVAQPSPQRADARATLAQIEAGTLDGLNIHGSAALKLSDIEAESGITRGAIYYHFKNKDALVRKVLVDWLSPLEGDLGDAHDSADAAPYDRLHAAVKTFVEAFCNAPGALRAIHELEPVDPTVAVAYRRCRSVFARRLAKIILDCGEGPEPTAEALGFVVHGMIAMIERLARDRFIIPDAELQEALPGADEMIAALAAILHRMAWSVDPPGEHGLPAPIAAKPL
ncbi:TetR/AcrR family transcriptional regulator [Sphingosinicella xenopeptidilytica]|uniref:TetR/AcrR family transcriptional regulator n=1 Tax=Sphingosinicella xenopeptidilytica TaxID=364098 RepID=A0ABW3C0A6_SPHXN